MLKIILKLGELRKLCDKPSLKNVITVKLIGHIDYSISAIASNLSFSTKLSPDHTLNFLMAVLRIILLIKKLSS